ncbi:TatD family hydrolase [Candidatus Micrarchaeota archaeon]|nr:TatD family hydrolase [Candidatus Micrarchaeota archaeon]
MELVDSHCHLFSVKNYQLPPDIIPVVVGYSHGSNKKAVEIARGKYPYVLGIAPQTALKEGTKNLTEWMDFIRESRPNAIGEIGLDYKWATTGADVHMEEKVFSAMLELADDMKLPVVIHSRDNPLDNEVPKNAIDDILERVSGRKYMMHFFSGDEKQAERVVEDGGIISVIHLHSKTRRKVINNVDLDKMVVESDCPYVGRTPDSIRQAIDYIAEVKGLSKETVTEKTTRNAKSFFGFD